MKTHRRKVQKLSTQKRVKLALSFLLALIVSSIMQLAEVQPTMMSREDLPAGTEGRVKLDRFAFTAATSNQFLKLELLSTWTEATRSKSHSTLLHIGQTEATGIRLDLGQSDASGVFTYYLVVGSESEANGYQVREFPLAESDLGDIRISLLISNEAYEFIAYTRSGRVLRSQDKSAPIDFRQIYLGGGPPDIVPGFTDVRLYPSETLNSSIMIEEGVYRKSSLIGLPESVFLLANVIFKFLLGISAALIVVFALIKIRISLTAIWKTIEVDLGSRLLAICVGLWVVVVPVWWVQAGYRDVPVTRNFSAPVYDLHCDPKIQGIGQHCFGDYYHTVNNLHQSFEPGKSNYPPVNYPPLALMPQLITSSIQDSLKLSPRAGLLIYLNFCVIALMVPSIFVLRARRDRHQLAAGFVLSICSLPSLITLDRGNNVAFIVPFLLAFCIYVSRQRFEAAALALAGAAAIKPQFLLAFMLFVGVRKWRALSIGLGLCGTVTVLGFALWPGNRIENVSVFVSSLITYGEGILISQDYPPSISASRGLYHFMSLLRVSTSIAEFAGFFLLVAALVTLVVKGKSLHRTLLLTVSLLLPVLVPRVTFAYYLIVVIPLVAVMLTFDIDRPNLYEHIILQIIAVVAALSLVPLPISLSESGVFISPHYSGMLWLLVCLSVLISAWIPKVQNLE